MGWAQAMMISHGVLSLSRCLVKFLLAAHVCACLLKLPSTISGEYEETWLSFYGYCQHKIFAANSSVVLAENGPMMECDSGAKLYIASLYWGVMLMCGITGGPLEREGFSPAEQLIFTVMSIMTGFLWSSIIGTFCDVMASQAPAKRRFNQLIDQLHTFSRETRLPKRLSERVLHYFHRTRHMQNAQERLQLMKFMSPALRGEVALVVSARWLRKVDFLIGTEQSFVVKIATNMSGCIFTPGENCPTNFLYIVSRGLCLHGGKIKKTGETFGHDMVVSLPLLRSLALQGHALSFLEVFRLSRADLLELVQDYPAAASRVRWAALRVAMCRMAQLIRKFVTEVVCNDSNDVRSPTRLMRHSQAFDPSTMPKRSNWKKKVILSPISTGRRSKGSSRRALVLSKSTRYMLIGITQNMKWLNDPDDTQNSCAEPSIIKRDELRKLCDKFTADAKEQDLSVATIIWKACFHVTRNHEPAAESQKSWSLEEDMQRLRDEMRRDSAKVKEDIKRVETELYKASHDTQAKLDGLSRRVDEALGQIMAALHVPKVHHV